MFVQDTKVAGRLMVAAFSSQQPTNHSHSPTITRVEPSRLTFAALNGFNQWWKCFWTNLIVQTSWIKCCLVGFFGASDQCFYLTLFLYLCLCTEGREGRPRPPRDCRDAWFTRNSSKYHMTSVFNIHPEQAGKKCFIPSVSFAPTGKTRHWRQARPVRKRRERFWSKH